jgi:hypothetical protein
MKNFIKFLFGVRPKAGTYYLSGILAREIREEHIGSDTVEIVYRYRPNRELTFREFWFSYSEVGEE